MHTKNKWLSEFDFTPTLIAEISHYIKTNELPDHIQTQEQHEAWARNFSEFRIENNKLFFENLEVIPNDPGLIRDVIKEVYDSPSGLGKGINQLSILIHNNYIGIRRHDVTKFLKEQPNYQMAASHPRIVSRPVQVTAPFQTWAIDLVDMSFYNGIKSNKGFNWILSVLDLFSHFVWLVPLKQKLALNVKNGIENIVVQNQHKFDTELVKSKLPGVFWSDNGTEFLGELSAYLKENGSKQIFNKAYVPVAPIEQVNRTIRMDLRHLFIKQKNLDWLSGLQSIATSINSNFHAKLQTTPLDMMHKFFSGETEMLAAAAQRSKAAGEAKFNKFYRQDGLKLGDHVRVQLASLYTSLRSRIKAGTSKLNIVTFSPEIFKVAMVYPPPVGQIGYNSYLLQDRNNKFIINPKLGAPQRFRFNELQFVPSGLTINSGLTQADADHLNQVKQSNDVVEQDQIPEIVHVAKIKPLKQPVPFKDWKGAQWTEALKSNLYELHGNRFEILKVEYDRKNKSYVVISAEFQNVIQGKKVKGAEEFVIDLAECLNLCKNQLFFTGDMRSYVDEHLPQEQPVLEQLKEPEEMNEPLPVTELNLEKSHAKRNLFGISGGHLKVVGGKFR